MKRKTYDIVYSIGYACACAEYLKRAGLRSCSGPFDWIVEPTFSERVDVIVKNFKGFFQSPKDFSPLPRPTTGMVDKSCEYFHDNVYGFNSLHDFPINVPIEQSFPEVSAKYHRRIERFDRNIRECKRVLLVWFTFQIETSDEDFIKGVARLRKHFGRNIDFLVIEHRDGITTPVRKELAPNVIRYYANVKDIPNPTGSSEEEFMGNIEGVLPLFTQYKSSRIVKMRIVKALVSCIPLRGFRHRLRARLREKGWSA